MKLLYTLLLSGLCFSLETGSTLACPPGTTPHLKWKHACVANNARSQADCDDYYYYVHSEQKCMGCEGGFEYNGKVCKPKS